MSLSFVPTAIVSTMEDGAPKTVMFLNRGDSFGDIAILNNARRETTVISRERIELLVMSDEVQTSKVPTMSNEVETLELLPMSNQELNLVLTWLIL